MAASRRYWLMKSEPQTYSVDDLARAGEDHWDGVRNFRARNFMREMQVGDLVLFYHSSTKPPGVAGLAHVAREAYPDPSQFDPESPYHDKTASPEKPRWDMVDLAFVEKFPQYLSLSTLKADPALAGMWVTKRGMRLSVQPVEAVHFQRVLERAGSRTRLADEQRERAYEE